MQNLKSTSQHNEGGGLDGMVHLTPPLISQASQKALSGLADSRRFLLIGFGAVGQGVTPLLLQALGVPPASITALAADLEGVAVAQMLGVTLLCRPVTPANYCGLLDEYLRPGDVLLNLAVEVCSHDLIAWCQAHDVLYLDTGIEPWPGGYSPDQLSFEQTTNHWLREQVLALRRPDRATAVVAHGANPGLISHLAKSALEQLAGEQGMSTTDVHWAALACQLGVQVIQIAERDTQTNHITPKPNEFTNTWSVHGLITELTQACEAGWGSHETALPPGAQRPSSGSQASIYWPNRRGELTKVASWVPSMGASCAWLVTHHEAISLADFLSTSDAAGHAVYRPTVYYAYQPCAQSQQSIRHWLNQLQRNPGVQQVIPVGQLQQGQDELGVLLCHGRGAYWFGSTLTLEAAKALAPHNSATTLQVAAGILGALVWMFENPRAGITEAEGMNSPRVLEVAQPFLGEVKGTHTDWQPGTDLTFQSFTAKASTS